MGFRQGLLRGRTFIKGFRQFSNFKFLQVTVNEDSGVSTVSFNRPPVNSLNLELLTELSDVLNDLKKNESSGMILTSSLKKVFCGGLDIMEMYKPDKARLKQFWTMLQEVWMQLYGSPFPTVAAINGHSPAGGCLLSMSCEYRVMVKNFSIGLNETQLGIIAPTWNWVIEPMKNILSRRETELALTSGKLFKTDEAFSVGLVDEVAEDKDDALERSEAFFERFEMIPPAARAHTKNLLRGDAIQDLKKSREADLQITFSHILHPQVQQSLEFYLALLKNKKAESS